MAASFRLIPLVLVLACNDDPALPGGGGDSGITDRGSDLDAGADAGEVDAGLDAGSSASAKRVFVTSARFNGNLGGLGGGDDKCQAEADAALLMGTFRAWISTPAQNAIQRMADTGPWTLVDGTTLVFATREQMEQGPSVPLNRNARGELVASAVWTGTIEDGTASDETCQSWTSGFTADFAAVGSSAAADIGWTMTATQTCSGSAALYCFEQ